MSAQAPSTVGSSGESKKKEPILRIEDLYVNFYTYDGIVRAIDGVYLEIGEGETYGLVGETGCGKSVTARAVLRLIPDPPGRITKGHAFYRGDDLLDGIESEAKIQERKHGAKIKRDKSLINKNEIWMQSIRGNGISMIFQEPMSALNPVFTIGDQLAEVFMLHRRKELLDLVFKAWTPEGVKEELERFVNSSTELSGMVKSIQAAPRSGLLVKLLKEGTSENVSKEIESLVKSSSSNNARLKLISIVKPCEDGVSITFHQVIWDSDGVKDDIEKLITSSPELSNAVKSIDLTGSAHGLLIKLTKDGSADKLGNEIMDHARSSRSYDIFMRQIHHVEPGEGGVVVSLRHPNPLVRRSYKKIYKLEGAKAEMRGFKSAMRREVQRIKRELKGKVTEEEIAKAGHDVGEICELAKKYELIIGDALSLQETVRKYEKRIFVGEISEKLSRRWMKTLHRWILSQMTTTALGESFKMLKLVNVPHPDRILEMYPFELSGGMQQRAMIAMALSCNPALLIADEPSTALDVTIQAQILELMKDLKRRIGTSIMLITHDLGVVAEMCLRVGVMYGGTIVEEGTATEIFYEQKHPYTKGLISSIPTIEKKSDKLAIIPGSVPNLIKPPSGCRFHPRCPFAMDGCTKHKPPDTYVTKTHRVACFLYGEGLPTDERKPLVKEGELEELEVKL